MGTRLLHNAKLEFPAKRNKMSLFAGGEQTKDGLRAIEALGWVYEHWIPKERIIKTNTWSSELSKLVRQTMLMDRQTQH